MKANNYNKKLHKSWKQITTDIVNNKYTIKLNKDIIKNLSLFPQVIVFFYPWKLKIYIKRLIYNKSHALLN